MTSERAAQIERICHAALDHDPAGRASFIVAACSGDVELRHEVESLVAGTAAAGTFLETPAIGLAASAPRVERSLVGRRLGSYSILEKLAAGGMGDVYRAQDMKLGREVAIKVLPDLFTADPERRARLEREARLLAAVNHPHITAIYGVEESDGVLALVLELVKGETLADRIARGMSVTDALPLAAQIVDALNAAHEKGIIHRDLKPANIRITPEGVLKVLDFGLAKVVDGFPVSFDVIQSREGVLVGTASYMSPEQTRGRPVDKRTDIWAFGCVLFEMLTGRPAFDGETVSDTISAILDREPDWSSLPDRTPAAIRRLLQRCLSKDQGRRLCDVGDARIEIEDATNVPQPIEEPGRQSRLLARGMLLMGMLAIASILLMSWQRSHARVGVSEGARESIRFFVDPPDGNTVTEVLGWRSQWNGFALSPDGRTVAGIGIGRDGQSRLWVRQFSSTTPRELPRTEGASYSLFWSPDGREVGFFAAGKLKRIDLATGSVRTVADSGPAPLGGTWNREGIIVFSSREGLYRISAEGGPAMFVVGVDRSRQENTLRNPQFLPDGRHFLFVARSGRPENSAAYVASLDGASTRLFPTLSKVVYATPGYLLYVQDNTLVARRFNPNTFALGSEVIPVEQEVGHTPTVLDSFFSVSADGVLAYQGVSADVTVLRWFDRSGRALEDLDLPRSFNTFRIAPDGKRVVTAFTEQGAAHRSIWILEPGRRTRLTFAGVDEWAPIWSPDGNQIAFGSNRNGPTDLYVTRGNGTGSVEGLLISEEEKYPNDWSADGGFLAFDRILAGNRDLLVMPLSADRKPIPVAESRGDDHAGRFSSDGHWIAYVSNETGRSEVYIQPFPPTGNKWLVSLEGGDEPRWRGDGRELFYLTLDGMLVAVDVTMDADRPSFRAPRPLFRAGRPASPGFSRYEPCPDGQRFLVNLPADPPARQPLTIVLNWLAGLAK